MTYRTERRNFRYFYINGKLHKMINVVRSRDEALAWCYSEHKKRIYQWSDIRRRGSRGFTVAEVARLVGRGTRAINHYIERGLITPPEMTYSLTSGKLGMRIYSEEDVFKIREIAASQHRGRPRNDGLITPKKNTPTEQELYSQVKYDIKLYTKNKDGEFIPLYMAEDW